MFRVAIDTGGTFTDYAAVDDNGRFVMTKVATNSKNPSKGIINGLEELARLWEISLPELLTETGQIVLGTTLALNALLENRGAATALLTTEGFRDALEMRRSRLSDQWDLRAPIPQVLVPRYLRQGIRERLDYKGDVILPLDREQVRKAAAELKRQGIDAIAVCFLFSFTNPAHEQEAAEILREEMPDCFITISSDIAPRIREYERTSTTVLNATLTPVLADYLSQLESELNRNGWGRHPHLIQNNGGITDSQTAKNAAVKTMLSGPAGGVTGGLRLAKALGRPNLILADMGGTSFDVSLISNESIQLLSETEINGYPVTLPVIDIRSVGAGGGSIASVDPGGRLIVGPRSAGANPGPACYERGGEEPTLTDAALVLGLLNPDKFLDGRQRLNSDKARVAVRQHLGQLKLSVEEAALAIYRITAAKMADAVRLITVGQGKDPREFSLVSAGGAFGLFAALIAEELHIREILVPVQGPVFCAWGMLGATFQRDMVRSCFMTKEKWDYNSFVRLLAKMKDQLAGEFDRISVPIEHRLTEITLEMKYVDQHHEICVFLGEEALNDRSVDKIDDYFHACHNELYGYAEPDKQWEIVNLRVTMKEAEKEAVLPGLPVLGAHSPSTREIIYSSKGPRQASVYDMDSLSRYMEGPAVIEFPYTTVLVPEGYTASVDERGFIRLAKE